MSMENQSDPRPVSPAPATRSSGSFGESTPGSVAFQSQSGGTRGTADELADKAKDKAGDLADKTRSAADDIADKAKEAATSRLSGQKDRATSTLGDVTEALHETGDRFRKHDQGAIAGYIDDAARQVESLSSYVRDHSVGDLLNEAEHLARREPALFIGGAFMLGILGARFLKSSQTPDRQRYGSSYSSDYRRPAGSRLYSQEEQGFGSYVPGGVAGDYTRTHEYQSSRVGSAAEAGGIPEPPQRGAFANQKEANR